LREVPCLQRGGGRIEVLGAGGIREKIFGIHDNFSQGIPDDPANLVPVFPVLQALKLIL
jgi:hypothetical protein